MLLGFAVLMFGISTMTDAVYPLRESERHGSLSKQEIEKTHDFRLLLEEYGKRYGI